MSYEKPTPKELKDSILSSRMQPDKARDILLKLRGHIDGMLNANGDASKILWHHTRLWRILHSPYSSKLDLARYALIASLEKDWFIPMLEAAQREHEENLAKARKGRTECAPCLASGNPITPWLLPDEACHYCEFRKARAAERGVGG